MRKPAWLGLRGQEEVTETPPVATLNHILWVPLVSSVTLLSQPGRDLGSIPGVEDPLEKEMATHSSILAWGIPWTEEPGWL